MQSKKLNNVIILMLAVLLSFSLISVAHTAPQTEAAVDTPLQIKVHFIDVGQADSIYIELPNDNDILIDAGNNADGPQVVNYLKNRGVDDIELLVASHNHEDHIGGLDDVMAAYRVENIIGSGQAYDSATYN